MMGRSSRMARTMRSAASTTPGSDSGSFNWVSLAARKATARPGSSIPRLINNWAVRGEIPAARESDAIRSESNGFSRHRVVIRVGSPEAIRVGPAAETRTGRDPRRPHHAHLRDRLMIIQFLWNSKGPGYSFRSLERPRSITAVFVSSISLATGHYYPGNQASHKS